MSWTEDDSAHFIDEGKYFVPEREAQIATICAAIPPIAYNGESIASPTIRPPDAAIRPSMPPDNV